MVQPALHKGQIPINEFLKFDMVWACLASMVMFYMDSVHPLDEFWMLNIAVPTTTFGALGFIFSHFISSVRYMLEDPESASHVMCLGRFCGPSFFW